MESSQLPKINNVANSLSAAAISPRVESSVMG
jgi:hypothetical protein